MPCFASRDLASSSSAGLRALMAILAPISPRPCAICRPRPREPPVTRTTLSFSSNSSRTPISNHLEQPGGTLAAADAHGDDHQLGATPPTFDERVSGEARAADPVGMTDRDGTAIDVQPLVRNAQLIAAVKYLTGEGLVQLPQIDVADFVTRALHKPRHRINRAYAHLIGFAAGDRKTSENSQRLKAALFRQLAVHDDHRTAAVGKLAGIAGRDHTARYGRTDLRNGLKSGVGTYALIGGDRHLARAES